MAKQSAVSAVVARIDADLAKWREIEAYAHTFGADKSTSDITDDVRKRIIGLLEMRVYVGGGDEPIVTAEKPKRGRKRKGLPAQSETETK